MKKLVSALCALSAAACALAFSACGEKEEAYVFAMPDGAPALAAAQLMAEDMQFGGKVTYSVVNANAIGAQVSGGKADVAVLPVNAAASFAGDGEDYKLLGTVTHGNLYVLSAKHTQELTADTLDTLAGKTVGCIQLESFVGGVFRMILDAAGVEYEIAEDVSSPSEDAVTLVNIGDPSTGVSPSAPYDYMIAAEPVVTAKTAKGDLKVVGDVQRLYGEGGFPQAVLVAKTSLTENDPGFVAELCDAVTANAEWIKTAKAEDVIAAINKNYGGATSSLGVGHLNPETVARCAVSFVPAAECKAEITSFLSEYSRVTGQQLSVSDAFFYNAK